jgi:hypothetical protein
LSFLDLESLAAALAAALAAKACLCCSAIESTKSPFNIAS